MDRQYICVYRKHFGSLPLLEATLALEFQLKAEQAVFRL